MESQQLLSVLKKHAEAEEEKKLSNLLRDSYYKKSIEEELSNYLESRNIDKITQVELDNLINSFCLSNLDLVDQLSPLSEVELVSYVQRRI